VVYFFETQCILQVVWYYTTRSIQLSLLGSSCSNSRQNVLLFCDNLLRQKVLQKCITVYLQYWDINNSAGGRTSLWLSDMRTMCLCPMVQVVSEWAEAME